MSSIKIKVCGMTQIEQVQQLAGLNVDYAGFIFYEKSPRYIIGKIDPQELKDLGSTINKVGVFVNEGYDVILKTVDKYGLNAVQLHGDETPDFCSGISSTVQTIKAFRLNGDEDLTSMLNDYFESVDYFLFDTKGEEYGGTGKKFNWDVLTRESLGKPYFLSGGLGPEDAGPIRKFTDSSIYDDLYTLDINSKFETEPGVKNILLIKKFMEEVFEID